MGIKEDKAALRAEMSAFRVNPEERRKASVKLVERILESPEWGQARVVLLFAALHDEPDVIGLMGHGRETCFPRFHADRGYAAARVVDAGELIPGQFGILEPPSSAEEITATEVDLVIVPGMAFDRSGNRLGRGRGFYDRWLAELAGAKLGIGFDHQLLDALPCEPHDMVMDGVLVPACEVR